MREIRIVPVAALAIALAAAGSGTPAPAAGSAKNLAPPDAPGRGGAVPRATVPAVAPDGPVVVPSSDVPIPIPDDDPDGIVSILDGPNLLVEDVDLILDDLSHTCVADLHVELTSPMGTTVEIIEAFPESGIFDGLGCPADFAGTVLDDEAPTNLADGAAPFTGSFNVEHPSVPVNPLSTFEGESAAGTWALFVSDLAAEDEGSLEAWSIAFVPEPTEHLLRLAGIAVLGGLAAGRRAAGRRRAVGVRGRAPSRA